MCGILGIALAGTEGRELPGFRRDLDRLFRRSESRGREAAGLAVRSEKALRVLKCACPASAMIRSAEYRRLLEHAVDGGGRRITSPLCAIGHSRLVTTGGLQSAQNNQPVLNSGAAGVHNGIVVNHERIFAAQPGLERHGEVDSEAIFALLRRQWADTGDLAQGLRATFAAIDGTASIAALFDDADVLVLATNNGSLFTAELPGGGLVFASERRFLAGLGAPVQLRPGTALVVELRTLARHSLSLAPGAAASPVRPARHAALPVSVVAPPVAPGRLSSRRVGLATLLDGESQSYLADIAARFPHDSSWQNSLRRCTRCILPETMPFIEFDAAGVCNYCRSYRPLAPRGFEALQRDLGRHRSGSGGPDCVVGVSGGRDSLYALHFLKTEFGMNPVAFTYDWGMVTDLARRNIARVCGRLGVEHVVLSADIALKRRFIRDNVAAWLRRPHLGAIPLFMAGDKQYFFHIRQARRELGVPVAVMGENLLERTDFKTGFAGLRPHRDPDHVYTLPWPGKARLAAFFAGQFLANPGYWNASLLDTFGAALCYYTLSRDYVNLYAYIPWREGTVVTTLRDGYGFELAPDSATTWRIGDGTAAFYNYIFFTVAGFTENDAFRSNQVREGVLTRAAALALAAAENAPRYETIFWYLDVIGLETPLHEVLRIVQALPRMRPRPTGERGGAA